MTRWKFFSLCCAVLISSALAMPTVQAQEKKGDDPDNESQLADYVTFAEVGLKVRQPQGMQRKKSFAGFVNEADKSSLLVTRLPCPLGDAADGFTKEILAARGWTLQARQVINLPEQSALLVHFEQPLNGANYEKWVVLLGDTRQSWMVSASFPATATAAVKSKLTTALVTTVITDTSYDPRDILPFTAKSPKSLKPVEGRRNMLAFSLTGKALEESGDDPSLMIVAMIGKAPEPADRQRAAESIVKKIGGELTIDSIKEIEIDTLPGYEILGRPAEGQSETPVKIYNVVLFDKELFILLMSQTGETQAKQFLPEFKATAESIRRRAVRK